jgi:TonB-linked SusC/RagA family outer membrane protein
MQLTVLVLLFVVAPVQANVFSQTINLSANNMPLEKVFVEIKKQTGYTFAYFETDLAKAKPVSLSVTNAKLTEVLSEIFANQPLTYTIVEKVVVVKAKSAEKKIVVSGDALSPLPIDVKGRIINEDGEPVEATITVKGTRQGTSSTTEGDFILRNVDPNAILVISGVGVVKTEEGIRGRSTLLVIRVKKMDTKLDEVQVIAYGTTSQRFTTGNTATVKAADIEKQPVNNPLLALSGRVPGVVVTQSNGIPGGGITIRIQGINNLNPNYTGSDPLIVVDGIPYPSQNLRTFSGGRTSYVGSTILGNSSGLAASDQGPQGSPLAYINPADIESIDILKDADATAIYGSKAANGAVLITTKKGKMAQPKIEVNIEQGWGKIAKKLDLLNSQQYMVMRREGKRNDNSAITSTNYDLRGLWDTTRYTDWQKELIGGTAQFTRLTAGISGGSANVSYLISSTYGRETTVFPGSNVNTKGSVHINLNASSSDQKFRVQFSASYMADKNVLPLEDFTPKAVGLAPVAPPLYNTDGSLNWAPDPSSANNRSTWINPLANKYTLFDNKTNNLIANAVLSYRLVPGLDIRSSFGYNNLSSDQFSASLTAATKPELRALGSRFAEFSFNNIRMWIVEPQINWHKKTGFGKFDLLLGSSIQKQDNSGRSLYAGGQPSDKQLKDMASATSITAGAVDLSNYRYNAFFGRLTYNLLDKYLLNLTARRDGSSRFGPANRFHNFGAIGIGWIFSEEKFLSFTHPFLSFGKLRGSYGTTGNDQIGNYQYMSLFRAYPPSIPYQNAPSLEPTGLVNPYLEWEETRKLQLGIDLGFFNNKLLLTANYVRNRSSNNLTSLQLPIITGFAQITENLAALIQNSGWEFSLTANAIESKKISWSINANITIPSNKLVAFPGLATSTLANQYVIGQSLSIVRDNNYLGIDPLTGTYKLSPIRDVFYDRLPQFYGGLQNNITIKNFEISFLLQFTMQKAKYPTMDYSPGAFYTDGSLGNQLVAVLDRWQKTGDIAVYQKYSANINTVNYAGNRDVADASYIRIKNASLSYQLPLTLARRIHLQSLRLFSNAQNLLTFTRYTGFDPESLSLYSLPPLRMITIGMRMVL